MKPLTNPPCREFKNVAPLRGKTELRAPVASGSGDGSLEQRMTGFHLAPERLPNEAGEEPRPAPREPAVMAPMGQNKRR